MARFIALLCLVVTLLCPVLCFAETAGEVYGHALASGDVCEAMSVGAVLDKADCGATIPQLGLVPFDGLMSLPLFPAQGTSHLICVAVQPARRPLSATRRHALLQIFLF